MRSRRVLAVPLAMSAYMGLSLLPGALQLPRSEPAADGLRTVDDAVAACWRTGLRSWPLVAYAQQLTAQHYRYYSCRNLWDTPARSFARRMGYCTQYNLALKQILDALGLASQAVFALRVEVVDNPAWRMGHTWLRVRVDGEARDVCAGNIGNMPGAVNFRPLTPILPANLALLTALHVGVIGFCGFMEWTALLRGRPAPGWMLQDFTVG